MSYCNIHIELLLIIGVSLLAATGWNDISWHDSSMITPNLQNIADESVILENFYVQSLCSPTRSSLMTGYYPSNIGSQHKVIDPNRPHGLPLGLTTLPEKLKETGYISYAVGKWHLGFCNKDYLPTSRGFDKFFGIYGGCHYYYNHSSSEHGTYKPGLYSGIDLHEESSNGIFKLKGAEYDGVYTSNLYRKKIAEYIAEHDPRKPMFFYVALQQTHSPVMVESEWSNLYPNVPDLVRRNYSGQVTLMDTMVGEVVNKLKEMEMYEDSLIIFHSDNGGDVKTYASNWPLRGDKGTYFEGGIKAIALIHGKGIRKTGYVNKGCVDYTELSSDPYEEVNIAASHPIIVKQLMDKLDKYRKTAWTFFPPADPACNPVNFEGFWSPGWC
uniref:Arylsulfatase J-like n=1 Tax=Saccoglossus kowalevskii TaxID=10224 RepID=A0ABM0MAD2_SACKO|nr:PREDICTED: arylsulfatase J-like [Saccoglossus kowalevskii]